MLFPTDGIAKYKLVHDGLDMHARTIQVGEIGVLLVEYESEVGASQNDGIEVFTLNDLVSERPQLLVVLG